MNIKLTLVSLLIFVLIGCKKEDEQNVNNADSALPPNITEPAPDPTDPPIEPPTDPSLPVNPTDFLVAEITENLPPVISINASYPLAFSFKNPSETETATEILISENLPTSFNKISNTCGAQLAPLTQCDIKGEITSPLAGDISASWTLNYKEGDPLLLSVSTRAEEQIKDQMTAQIRNGLPTQITTNKTYPFSIRYKNNSTNLNATGLNLTFKNEHLLSNLSNKCVGILEPQRHCTVMGNISTDKPGSISFSTVLNYSEGIPEEINLISTATETNTITGHFNHTPPPNIALNTTYPVSFIFTNTSKAVVASQIQLTPNYPPEFTPISNDCTHELAPGAQCQVVGEILSTQVTDVIPLSLTLQYQEGAPVTLSTTTSSTLVAVVGEIRRDLPINTEKGSVHTVNFRFTNKSETLSATEVRLSYSDPSVFQELSNNCTETLGPNAWCSITGVIKISNVKDFNFSSTMHFSQGNDTPVTFTSSTTNIPITTRFKGHVPFIWTLGKPQTIHYEFLNASQSGTATNLEVSPSRLLYFKVTKNTCKTTLGPGQSCVVSAEITPQELRTTGARVTISYAEGEYVHLETPLRVLSLDTFTRQLNTNVLTVEGFYSEELNINPTIYGREDYSAYVVLEQLQNKTVKSFLPYLQISDIMNKSSSIIFEINGQPIEMIFSASRPKENIYYELNAADLSETELTRKVYITLPRAEFNKLPAGNHLVEVVLLRQRWESRDYDARAHLKIHISR